MVITPGKDLGWMAQGGGALGKVFQPIPKFLKGNGAFLSIL